MQVVVCLALALLLLGPHIQPCFGLVQANFCDKYKMKYCVRVPTDPSELVEYGFILTAGIYSGQEMACFLVYKSPSSFSKNIVVDS
jgi:hypothetical protein